MKDEHNSNADAGRLEQPVRPQPPAGVSECCTCGFRWRTGQNGRHSCAQQMRQELDVTDKLLDERNRLLQSIPECENHGDQCIPHAMAWVRNSIRIREALAELVALKDLKERIEAADISTYSIADAEAAQAMDDEYTRRKGPAWQAARDALGPNVRGEPQPAAPRTTE